MSCIVQQKQLVKCVTFYVYSWLLNNHFIMHADMLRNLDLMSINISLYCVDFFGFNKQRWRKLKLLNLKMEERKFVKENPFRIQISNFHGEWMKNYANLSAICRLLCHNSKVRFLFSHQQFNFQFFDERKNHHGIFYAKRRRNILVRLNLSKKNWMMSEYNKKNPRQRNSYERNS